MKLPYLFLLILIGNVQLVNSANLSLGIKGGIGISGFYDKKSDVPLMVNGIPYPIQEHQRITPAFNCFLTLNINKYLSGQIELLYSMKGNCFIGLPTNSRISFDGNINLDYLELPILLIGSLFPNSLISPYLYLGPSFSILINENGSLIVHDSVGNRTSTQRIDQISDYNSFDIGIPVGLGSYFNIGKHRLLLDIRYTPCLISVAKDPTLFFSTPGGKNQNWNISLGYSFNFYNK
jgi:hypothetical protein